MECAGHGAAVTDQDERLRRLALLTVDVATGETLAEQIARRQRAQEQTV